MRIRHLAALVVGAGLVLTGPAALAAPVYPPGAPTIGLSADVVAAGQAITVTGHGFAPLSAVIESWTGAGSLGLAASSLPFGARSLSADAVGAVTSTITFTTAGTHVVTLAGKSAAGAPVSLSATVTVRAAAAAAAGTAAAGSDLPRTGFPLAELLLGALGLVLLGGLVVAVVRQRRRTTATAPHAADQPLQPAH
jgi:hypothetical protein